ncbi:MAG: TetR/AcrR family transcriptional regulator [Polyangiaceae bacterium]
MPRLADHRTKIELLRAAELEFAEHGLASAKVEAITARAGVSKGAFYLHFDSKEDCFRTIVEGLLARIAACVDSVDLLTSTPTSLEELLEGGLSHDIALLEVCWQSRGLMRMLLDGGGGAPHAYLLEEFRERTRKLSEEILCRFVQMKLYRDDIEPRVVSGLISGAYERLIQDLIRQEKKPDIAAWCRQLLDLITRGLLAHPVNGANILDPKVNLEKGR